jgi:hypothetical protein
MLSEVELSTPTLCIYCTELPYFHSSILSYFHTFILL